MHGIIRNVYKIPRLFMARKLYVIQRAKFHKTSELQSVKNVYLIDEKDATEAKVTRSKFNTYTNRSFTCGELRLEHVGLNVTLCGWLEYQRMDKFLVLRDGYGQVQCLIPENNKCTQKLLSEVPYESVLKVEGAVVSRPKDMINKKQSTGEVEIVINNLIVLNKAKPNLPFNIREFQKAKEPLRMQYKYLDMRFVNMQRNIRVRSDVCMSMREFLVRKRGFVDVETPTLFKATPGGAQEFIVPTRFPNEFYSLVQSPQQFKQMLMAGAIDRYFQVARCYRDETSRPDRQPEFTQLDIEMSFVDMEGVIQLVEEMLQHIWPSFLPPIPKKFHRMTCSEAMESYGSDKPDLRYDFKLKNCTDILRIIDKFKDVHASSLIFGEPYTNLSKSIREKLSVNQFPNTNLVQLNVKTKDDFIKKTEKLFSQEISQNLFSELKLEENSVLFLVFGERTNTLKRLGKIREDYVNHLEANGQKVRKEGMELAWIIDFPLFEPGDEAGTLTSAHHPFTAPHPDDIELIHKSPLQVRGQSYDLVLNGNEIAGGSIRIHHSDFQKRILDMLNIETKELSHMLEMLASGCPPHGGIAIGLDRLFSVILNTPSIRDVIAFPKTFEGRDPLSGAPSKISDDDKKLYCIQSIDKV